MTNSEAPPPAPFTFKAAQQKPTEPNKKAHKAVNPNDQRLRGGSGQVIRDAKPRKRRAKAPNDVLVLKACLRQLRTLDPKDAWRTIETLRVLFK